MLPRRSWCSAAILATLLSASAAAAPAGRPIEVENLRVGLGEKFKVGAWTPVWVTARAGVESFDGIMQVVVNDESGTPAASSLAIRVGAGESKRFIAYARPGSTSGDMTVRFLDRDGKVKGSYGIDAIRPNNTPAVIFADDIAVLGLGKPQGIELLPTLPGLNGARSPTTGTNAASAASVVEVLRLGGLDGSLLPGRAIGYDALDAVVIDTNDKDLMTALSVQGEALRDWVAQGGHAVVAVGANWQAVQESPLAPMLPARLAGTIPIKDVRTIESFAGASNQLQPAEKPLTLVKLEGVEEGGGKVLCATASSPIVVRGAYGFGRVTLVALDVDSAPFATWADRGLFWLKAIDLRPTFASITTTKAATRFGQFGPGDLSSVLRESLEQFPGVKLIPFGWVAFFIFLYILLIGPGDYLFLRKVVKRMEYTWITFPAIVLVVSGVAYWAAYKAKGTELRVNQVDVVDVDVRSKAVRGASFVNIFSPQNRDYDVAITPRPLRPGDPAATGTQVRISWFGAPEQGLRGMGGGGRSMAFGSAGYGYGPVGSAERVEGVRIPIWSTKAFVARWNGPASGGPVVDSDLAPSGIDRLTGTVTNRLDVPIRGAILAFNTQVYSKLGTLEPNVPVRVELTPDRSLSPYLKELREGFSRGTQPFQPRTSPIDRAALMGTILFHDSDTTGFEPIPSRPLHDLDLTGQLLLDRPILMGAIDAPATDLDLGATSAPPRGDRTTILRAILPLPDREATKKGKK